MGTTRAWPHPRLRKLRRQGLRLDLQQCVPLRPLASLLQLTASFADDGTWEASLFPAHSLGVTSVSWAPGVGIGALTNPQAGAGADGQEALQVVKRFATGGCDGMVKIWAWK